MAIRRAAKAPAQKAGEARKAPSKRPPSMLYRARAPLRISFCGGGTDVDPYPAERGGVVLSTTIDKFAHATLRPRSDGRLTIHSLDYDVVADYRIGKGK